MEATTQQRVTSAIEHVLLPDDPHDQQVIANCHPPRHVNPTPTGKYNLIAIGAGAAGLVSAGGAGGLGAKAAIIEPPGSQARTLPWRVLVRLAPGRVAPCA